MTFNTHNNLMFFELTRMFERVPHPWDLFNYVNLRIEYNASYFGVAYRNFEHQQERQIVAVY